MTITASVLASSFQTGEILSLVLPVAVLIAITVWYVVMWRRGEGER